MPATDPPLELRPLTLRVHWTDGGGRAVPFDLVVPVGRSVRLGREPRQPATHPQPDPEFGADLVADKRDLHVSNNHATLVWDGVRLRVQKRPGANNPVFVLDRDNPAAPPRPADDFTCGPFDQFRIGNTQFTLLPGAEPVERSCSGEELAGLAFVDAEHHLDALAELPDLIHRAADEAQLLDGLLTVALEGVPRADIAAMVGLDPAGEVVVRAADGRRLANPDLFRPSRRLVRQVLTEFENRFFVWSDPAALAPADAPTLAVGVDWAVCVRVAGPRDEALYLAGRAVGGLVAPRTLQGDVKFAKLAGDIFSGLRELLALQRQAGQLEQMVSPAVRRVIRTRSLEEVIAPRECEVTVLFCDLRGFTRAVAQGEADLMGTWDSLSEALAAMTRAIVNEDGVVGDFQGDATMGFWGWPLPQPDQAERAARAALSIRREVRRFAQRRNHPLAGMECGIGIARGPAVAGRLGTYEQAKIGVFGPVVNRAARLEAATKRLGVPILIDAAVYDHLCKPGAVAGRLRKVARVVPKGLAEPLLIAELLPPLDEPGGKTGLSEEHRRRYEAALNRFQAGDWPDFLRLAAALPADGPADFIKRYIQATQRPDGKAPDGWDGGIPVSQE